MENYLLILWLTRTTHKFPLLIQPATYQSGGVCLFLQSPPALHIAGTFSDYIWETSNDIVTQHLLINNSRIVSQETGTYLELSIASYNVQHKK